MKVIYIIRDLKQRRREHERKITFLVDSLLLCLGLLGFCFFRLILWKQKAIEFFSINTKTENVTSFLVPRTLKKIFSHSNFSINSVQVLSSMHSNVQLLYLLLYIIRHLGSPKNVLRILITKYCCFFVRARLILMYATGARRLNQCRTFAVQLDYHVRAQYRVEPNSVVPNLIDSYVKPFMCQIESIRFGT